MKKTFNLLAISIAIMLLSAGCGQGPDTGSPPEINYGQDLCEECGMIITEPRFSAAYYAENGTARIFDDIGGMCTYYLENQENVATFWVHDYETEAWLKAEDAHFVQGSDIYTPMAFGVVAFSEMDRAKNLAEEISGTYLTFEQLLEHYENHITTQ